jgi:hypothetical protein
MPYSYNVYTGNGSTTQFTVGFPYIRQEHVKVYVAYVDTAYTYVNNTTVQLATAPGAGVRVEVRRITPVASVLVDFADGSTLVAADLDTSNLQHLYLEQELDDYSKQTISIDPATGLLTASGQRITNVADPTLAQDATTKAYVDTADALRLKRDGTQAMTGALPMGGFKVTGLGNPTAAQDAATKTYVDNFVGQTTNIADSSVTTAKLANSSVTTAKVADGAITSAKIADGTIATADIGNLQVTAAKIADNTITSAKLTGATVVTNAEVAGVSPNDTSFYTTSASDLRYFRQDSSETINSGMAWSGSDGFIATTAAIDARIIDLVDDVGGFVPIANENSFPATNPDINNPDGTGTVVSIALMTTSRTPSSGTVSIANGSGSSTVTITGCGSTVLAAGFGVLVETTSTLHTYTFHRLTPKATEVTTVASISGDVTTVAGIAANVTTVAGISGNVTTVAGNTSNINTAAANVADISTTAGSIANVNTIAGSIANVNTTAGSIAGVNTVAGISGNVTTVAGVSGNVTTVAGVSGNVTTVATNIANVVNASTYLNAFLALYLGQAATDPAVDPLGNAVTTGDFYFNNGSSQIRVYNGVAWQSFAENAFGNTYFANSSFSIVYTATAGTNTISLGDLAVGGGFFPDENSPANRMSLALGAISYNLGGL